MGEALNWTDVTSRWSIGERTVYYLISEVPHFHGEGAGDSGYTSCTGDVTPSRVCFPQFLSGKGVIFRPNSPARGVFLSCFDTARSFCK